MNDSKIRKFIKSYLKKNRALVRIYRRINWLKEVPFREYLDIKKMSLFFKIKPNYTMVSYRGLCNLYELAMLVEKNKMEGCFVECGVWRGGCAAVMAYVVRRFGSKRKIWLFDSFRGLPDPTENDGQWVRDAAGGNMREIFTNINWCLASREDVIHIFSSLGLYDTNNIMIVEGWFQDTLPEFKNKVGPIAILRLDCDWYESTKCCLGNLYNNVICGGYVILDDYGSNQGCKKAADEFLNTQKINIPVLKQADEDCYYFQKP